MSKQGPSERFSVRLTADTTEAEQVAITRCNKRETKDETVLCSRSGDPRDFEEKTLITGEEEEGFLHEERGKRRERKKRVSLSKSLGPSRDFHSGSRGVGKMISARLQTKLPPLLVELMLLGDSLETRRFSLLMSPYSAGDKLRVRREIGDY